MGDQYSPSEVPHNYCYMYFHLETLESMLGAEWSIIMILNDLQGQE